MSEHGTRPLREFSRSLPMLLLRAHQSVMNQFRPVLRRHGVTEHQWRVLRALSTRDTGMRITDLAKLSLISGPSLTRILRTLEAQQWIDRGSDQDDLRAASIALSADGRELIERIAPDSEARYAEIAACLGPRELKSLTRQLTDLPQRLRQVDPG